jgi:hypothetical protein
MAKLIYDAFTSLDGYVADENGNFEWAELDEEVHAFIKQPREADQHLSLWAQDVRDDGRLGDARGHSPSASSGAGVRADLAGG